MIREKLSQLQPLKPQLQPIYVRNAPRQAIPAGVFRRQVGGRWFTTHSTLNAGLRRFTSSAQSGGKHDRSSLPRSAVGAAVGRLTTRAPFASTLRPNLTGGALPRTAGGYSMGAGRVAGVRHFSHTPTAPAEVMSNVSAAVRAFWLSGQRAQFDGLDRRSGQKQFKSVSQLRDQAGRKMRSTPLTTPGSYVEFNINPTVTAMGSAGCSFDSKGAATTETLNREQLLECLSIDFARAVKDLGVVIQDLKRLSSLGDLPLTRPENSVIRVSFPGCDASTVEHLCDEVGVQRGVIRQDKEYDAIAYAELPLQYPFAPSRVESPKSGRSTEETTHHHVQPDEIEWHNMMTSHRTKTSAGFSRCSNTGYDLEGSDGDMGDHGLLVPSGYGSLHGSSHIVEDADSPFAPLPEALQVHNTPSDYEGLEGIYRFLELCDNAARR